MQIAIIGAGVLGTSLGILLRRAGHEIVAMSSRTLRSSRAAVTAIGGGTVVSDPGTAPLGADVVILAVPDRTIPVVAIQVAAGGALRRGAVVAHLSGALPAGVLAGVRAAGGTLGSMHPLQSFADVETAVTTLPGCYVFLEGDDEAVATLDTLVRSLDAKPVPISSAGKALYHAAAVVASNYLVTIADFAADLMSKAGVSAELALPALLPLMSGTLRNLASVGLPGALTGPISRGDLGTVRQHLHALRAAPGDLVRVYAALGRKTVEVALRQGRLDRRTADEFLRLFEE